MTDEVDDVFDTASDIGTNVMQTVGLGEYAGHTKAQGKQIRAGEAAAAKRKRIASAPRADSEASRRAAQRRRARTKAGTGRAGTMLSSDTLG